MTKRRLTANQSPCSAKKREAEIQFFVHFVSGSIAHYTSCRSLVGSARLLLQNDGASKTTLLRGATQFAHTCASVGEGGTII